MSISDRDYAYERRRPRGPALRLGAWSVTTWLIVINCAVFLLGVLTSTHGSPVMISSKLQRDAAGNTPQVIPTGRFMVGEFFPAYRPVRPATDADVTKVGTTLLREARVRSTGDLVGYVAYRVEPVIEAYGHFSTQAGFRQLEVWRLITFQFLHANITHVAMNMFSLFMFGPVVEGHLGRKKFLAFYLVCGIFGGLMYLFLNLLGLLSAQAGLNLPVVLIHDATTHLVGASAGCFGVIMACAYISPNTEVILPIPPIAVRMKILAYGYFCISLISLFMGARNAGGEAAHVGGALAGFFFIRNSHLLRDFFDVFTDSRRSLPQRNARPRQAERGRGGAGLRLSGTGPATADEARMDALLGKIRDKGRESLTREELDFLKRQTRARQMGNGGGDGRGEGTGQ